MPSRATLLATALVATACTSGPATYPTAATSIRSAPFDPTRDEYFAAPWPDDRRLDPDGTLRTLDFPNPRNGPAFSTTLRTADRLVKGWGVASPLYVTASGPLDPSSLATDALGSLEADAPVQLVDLARRVRRPVELRYTNKAGLFTAPHTLAVRPVPGLQLEPSTRHTLVVTRRVRDAGNDGVGPDPHLLAVLERRAGEGDLAHFDEALDVLSSLGVPAADVAGLVVFTTQAVTDELVAIRDVVLAGPAPVVDGLVRKAELETFDVYEGSYDAPNFMHGEPPYELSGGEFRTGPDGLPVAAFDETMRLKACIPTGDVPASGLPVVIYSHGTGGSFHTVVSDGTCALLAREGIAVFATDQVLSGPRAPAGSACLGQDVEVCFFNVVNAVAGRNLLRQSAIDQLSLRRALASFGLAASQDRFGRTVTLRLDDIGFLGHSQGALTGSLSVPLDASVRYAVLSATGGHLATTLLERIEPDVKSLLESGLFLALDGVESLDTFHPALALVQTLAEAVDPLNAAPLWNKRPLTGAKHVLTLNGWLDEATPISTAEYFAIAGGFAPRASGFRRTPVFGWAGLQPLEGGVQSNAATGDPARPKVTAAFWSLAQYDHFPFFRSEAVRDGVRAFFSTAFSSGVPGLPAVSGTP